MENNNYFNPQNYGQNSQNYGEQIVEIKGVQYTKRKGKFGTVIALCLAVMVLGGGAGLGASYIYNQIYNIVNSSNSYSGYIGSLASERDNLPIIPENTVFGEIVNGSDTLVNTVSDANGEQLNAVELFEAVNDAVVGIKLGTPGRKDDSGIIGSGVIFTTDGFIITCEHVISGAEKIIVVVDEYGDASKQNEYEAEVFGYDVHTDLAVIKITRKEEFRAAPIGNSSDLKVGQDVCAIGNPVGLEKTMTKGIISGLQRNLGDDAYELPSIQTDAPLNMGNSGCPLFDMYGNVVGIVNKKIVYGSEIDNLGFAISIDEAKPIINELMTNGSISSRPMLGIMAREISPYNYTSFGVEEENGLYIDMVKEGTPAAESGLSRGDIITHIDGKTSYTISDVQSIIKDKNAGDDVTVTVVRYDNYGKKETIKITFALANSE